MNKNREECLKEAFMTILYANSRGYYGETMLIKAIGIIVDKLVKEITTNYYLVKIQKREYES